MKEKIEKLVNRHGVKKLFLAAVILSLVLFCIDRVTRDFVLLNITPKSSHTATLLQDGKVLITGRYLGGNEVEATAEIFDPKTRKFTKTGDMTIPRMYHWAVLLQDGRVLVSGGTTSGWTAAKTAEIYDPSTGVFTQIKSSGQGWPTAYPMILLNDGRVLMYRRLGLNVLERKDKKVAQLFDPKTNTFSDIRPCLGKICPNRAVLMDDGNVFLSCDTAYYNFRVSCVNQIFNPSTGRYTPTGKTKYGHRYGAVLKLANGEIGVFGGDMCVTENDCGVEIYSPSTGEFRKGANFPGNKSISSQSAVLLDNGKVLLVGGEEFIGDIETGHYLINTRAYLYDPVKDRFKRISRMHYKRGDRPILTKLKNGDVLIVGGNNSLGMEIFADPPTKLELYKYKGGK